MMKCFFYGTLTSKQILALQCGIYFASFFFPYLGLCLEKWNCKHDWASKPKLQEAPNAFRIVLHSDMLHKEIFVVKLQ